METTTIPSKKVHQKRPNSPKIQEMEPEIPRNNEDSIPSEGPPVIHPMGVEFTPNTPQEPDEGLAEFTFPNRLKKNSNK